MPAITRGHHLTGTVNTGGTPLENQGRDAISMHDQGSRRQRGVTGAPIVATELGRVRGFWRGSSAAYLGLPFAAAPVGPLRFAAPGPHPGWAGVRYATTFGATPQRRPFGDVTTIPEPSYPGEETLNVNIFTPAPKDEAALLPVLVWIHGGGFKAGSPSSEWYDGAAFNRDGVVTVSVSYRLGFDGFGWIENAPHNRGLRDQIAALLWVRNNILAFGGDPSRVTIAGQSAGGASVLCLLASPLASGLFHAAIAQSPPVRVGDLKSARALGLRLAELAGKPSTRAALAALTEDHVLDLQARIEQELPTPSELHATTQDIVATGGLRLPFAPYIDGDVLPCAPGEALAAGPGGSVPLIIGASAHEFALAAPMFTSLVAGLGRKDVEIAVSAALGSAGPAWCASHHAGPGGPAGLLAQLVTDSMIRSPMVSWASSRRAPTWLYDYRYLSPGPGLALHCAELPFVWDHLDAERVEDTTGPNPPQALADVMHSAWVHFVRHHAAPWPHWDAAEHVAMIYDGAEPSARPAFEAMIKPSTDSCP
ncbi:carboxylesterase family protein [Arthrobacter sp. R3-55]